MLNESKPPLRTAVFAGAISLLLAACSTQPAPKATLPVVDVQTIQTQHLAVEGALAGRTAAHMASEVRPQVSGIIQQRQFVEGQEVEAGQVLYQIDPRSYEAAYASAKADLARAKAAVLAAKPRAERYRALAKIDAVSKQDRDEAISTLRQGEASVQAASAALETAKINLNRTSITAPISGRIGTSAYTPGALVTASQETPLTTIRQLDPIYVDVTQTSAQWLSLRKKIASGELKAVDGKVQVKILLEDGSTYDHDGTLEFVGSSVATGTGSITLRAVVPNPDGLLLPGMYVRAALPMAVDDAAILVPQRAVSRNTRGEPTVKLVDPDGKVEERIVETGQAIKDQWVVTGGLKAGERLIVTGASRVADGQQVAVGQTTDANARTVAQGPSARHARNPDAG